MRIVTYSMGISADGYIVGPDGTFDWTVPDAEVFRFWIDENRTFASKVVYLRYRVVSPRGPGDRAGVAG